MQEPTFADMSPEDLLAWIENAEKALDQKIAAAKADIEERQQRLARLLARRDGVEAKAKAKPAAGPGKPRGRPPAAQAAKPEAKAQEEKPEAIAAE
ncbi:hypothetical protein RA307_19600 [Xanthobacteraceae bacterium Astr-EGSB]|uniref:hypothetical protein n=1 Tax=Astrobacterium formosum TaxID=3069710 RepID=UPI0027B054BB|nr:hypothetical protein [Xanthobacteraceae bacterium Astr-EGSB]